MRPSAAALEPYDPAFSPVDVVLSANENNYGVPPEVAPALAEAVTSAAWNRYPVPLGGELREKLAAWHGVAPEQVIVGNGGDELLFNFFLAFGGAGHALVSCPPTFSVYGLYASMVETPVVEVPREKDFAPNVDALVEAARSATLVVVTSPNNPTGDLFPREGVRRLCEACPGIVLVDEAYIEFADPGSTVEDMLGEYQNLAVLHTFSKAFALAGARVGYVLASPAVVAALAAVRQPYSVSPAGHPGHTPGPQSPLQHAGWPRAAGRARVAQPGKLPLRPRAARPRGVVPPARRALHTGEGLLVHARPRGLPAHHRGQARGERPCGRGTHVHPEGGMTMARVASVSRQTAETSIEVTVNLDGTGTSDISTGVGFFDHMLTALSRHSLVDLTVHVKGDTWVDDHHTVEDTGIVLGQALRQALGDKRGIRRFGDALVPLDESLVMAAVDISGRGELYWDVPIGPQKVGTFDTGLGHEFFCGLARDAGMTVHLREVAGENAHHILEATFKSFARALRAAVEPDPRVEGIPSTKGAL